MSVCRLCRIGLLLAPFLCFLSAALSTEEVEALRDIFQAAGLYWNETKDPCTLSQVKCDVKRESIVTLTLKSQGITWLPESIGQFQSLQILRLQSNHLVALPDSIGELRSLEDLYLEDNRLTALPDSIGKLQRLLMLDLNINQLTSLPESVGKLRSLRFLYVNVNQLAMLPEAISQLSLSHFQLARNYLTGLPESIGQMKSCRTLNANSNQLTSVPESIAELSQLNLLDLGSNQLTAFPDLRKMEWLSFLSMQNNQLLSLPEWIGDLKSLAKLRLESNKLTWLPVSITQLQNLMYLHLQNNQLNALPDSIGDLKHLEILSLDSNRLISLPESVGSLNLIRLHLDSNLLTSIPRLGSKRLVELRIAKNRLTTLPDFGNMTQLKILSLQSNYLEKLSQSAGNLNSLKVALLHSNRIRDSAEICKLGLGDSLQTLYLHGNRLPEMPPCLNQFVSLEVLTLHRNFLTGEVPEMLAELRNLNVLTLHGNYLHGTLPEELANAPKLAVFSAHSNHLVGPIPSFRLHKDCVNDASFVMDRNTCEDYLPWLVECRAGEFPFHCPKTCGCCHNASARGPVLLLHDNRLSCSLPQEVTSWPEDLRSISLIGNMLGNGSHALPQWIHSHEHQPFLYMSDHKTSDIFKRTILLACMFTLCWVLVLGTSVHRHILVTKAGSDLTRRAHAFVFQMGTALSVMAAFLLVLYYADARYYACGSSFSSTTVGNFSNPYHGNIFAEWAVAIVWSCWVAVGAYFLRRAPTGSVARDGEITSWVALFIKFIYCVCWLCIVALLSFPSVAYAVVCAIPFNNTFRLSAWGLKFFHYQAAFVMVLVDMFITPKVVKAFSDATGMRRSMLMMAARLGTMWLAAVLSTVYLTTHCMNGWTHLWKVPRYIGTQHRHHSWQTSSSHPEPYRNCISACTYII